MDAEKAYDRARQKVEERIGFLSHLVVFVIINAFLFFLDYRDNGSIDWAYWPLVGWGIGLVMHGLHTFVFGEGSQWKERMIKREMEKNTDKES
jgi:two-component system LytT family sensor kinase